jgi:DNA-binding winged helix-turn-helix (wHTH) protein
MQERNCLNFGPFRLDARNQQLWRGQEVIRLTNKALTVLRYLAEHSGQLVTKDDLFVAVWPGVIVSDAALVVCIRELRRALGDERRTPQFIR